MKAYVEAHHAMDTLPYGDFLEIEADKKSIRQWAEKLGLSWGNRLVTNYLEMFARIREKYGLPFTDVTFENFEGITVDSKIFPDKE